MLQNLSIGIVLWIGRGQSLGPSKSLVVSVRRVALGSSVLVPSPTVLATINEREMRRVHIVVDLCKCSIAGVNLRYNPAP